ncbi:unnamed protein product [Diamesa serratosioi]
MFFLNKKKNLWKRLWRSRVCTTTSTTSNLVRQQQHQQPLNPQPDQYYQSACETSAESYYYQQQQPQHQQNEISQRNFDLSDQTQLKFRTLVSKLKKDSQLETLCQAVESVGVSDVTTGKVNRPQDHQPTDCVLVPRGLILGEEPQVIACRLWRWQDLYNSDEIKRIPTCPNEKDPIYICCNPAHWSRICRTETPPPPYRLYAMDRLKAEEISMDQDGYGLGGENGYQQHQRQQIGSQTTDGEDYSSSNGWCQLAYWEMKERVGRLFPVDDSAVNVFSEQTRGAGLCIKTLAEQHYYKKSPDVVLKTREKIGLGVTLSRESDGVWLYNRSSSPVFVHSPTLCDMDSRSTLPCKVPSGHCLRAFDPLKANETTIWPPHQIFGAQLGPVDTHSVRISFVKGWGLNYSRQDVTACPCWLEVLLSRNELHCTPCR